MRAVEICILLFLQWFYVKPEAVYSGDTHLLAASDHDL